MTRRFAGLLPRGALALAASASLCIPATARAEPRMVVPPALQASAALCLGEALRLCPAALSSRDHGLSCILGKRRLLSAPCRVVYDQGLRLLRWQDLHLTLRRPGAR